MKKLCSVITLLIFTLCLYGCSTEIFTGTKSKPEVSSQSQQNSSKENEKSKENDVKEQIEQNSKEYNKGSSASDSPTYDSIVKLKSGDNGERVKELQRKLNKFNYKLSVDGQFGASTDFAVRNFQAKVKITSDGVAGTETFNKLDSTPAKDPYLFKPTENKISSSQAISSTNSYEAFINSKDCSSNTDYYIYTNLSQHIVCVFTGSNGNWKLLNSFSCSSGKSSTPTIRGHFTLGTRGTYFVTDNGLICKYFTQISGDYLFHSILYDSKGNVADNRLGVNISHGCIRLATANAKYLYDNIPSGTAIWIQ